MQRGWFDLVAGAVWGRLAELAAEASRDDGATGTELGRLVAAWRALLRLHQAAPNGRCVRCARPRLGALRNRTRADELCSVWQVAVAYFVRDRGERAGK